jgi:hypothetical protein
VSTEMEEYKHYMALPQMLAVSTLIDARIRETGTLMAQIKELEAKAQVCMDLHEALGVKFGDDPYARIISLQKAEARVEELEDAIAAALRIKQLWGPSITGDVMENRALYIMLTKFEELVK